MTNKHAYVKREIINIALSMAAMFLLLVCAATARAQSPQDAKFATVFGEKIHYTEAGAGPTVILLHGLGGDISNWAPTIGPLAVKFHVIAIDQIGFGLSDKPLINYRVGTLVDFLDQF